MTFKWWSWVEIRSGGGWIVRFCAALVNIAENPRNVENLENLHHFWTFSTKLFVNVGKLARTIYKVNREQTKQFTKELMNKMRLASLLESCKVRLQFNFLQENNFTSNPQQLSWNLLCKSWTNFKIFLKARPECFTVWLTVEF